MNNERRKILKEISALVCDARLRLEDLRDEEQNAFDNLPEGLQSSERGDYMLECIEQMEEAGGQLEEAQSVIDGLCYIE